MRWSEPQRAMLREMGLRLWLPQAAAGPDIAEPVATGPSHAPADESAGSSKSMFGAPPSATSGLALTAATMDWPVLQSTVESCRACSLCENRRQTVFGLGHLRAQCMVVGEAPGEQEDASGKPFVGDSGQLLDRMLRALGLSRDATEPADAARQVFITNTVKCRPPRNRNPTAEELSACQPFLQRQVALVQPKVIIAMGAFAVRSLLGSDEPIGKLRGRLHSWRGVPVVVTYHPAYLLRQPTDKARAWEDLCLAATCLELRAD